MLILSEAVTREIVDLEAVVAMVKEEAKAQSSGRVIYPDPPTQVLLMDEPRCRYRVKSCALPDIPVVGIRIIGYPLAVGGEHGSTRFVILSDPRSGEPLALIDDHWTYTLRTAASAVVGLTYLTAERPLSVAMVGAGNLAGAMLMLLEHVGRLGAATVTSRRRESRQAFARKWSDQLGVPVHAKESLSETLENAEIVVTSTNANARLIEADQIAPGSTLCTLGRFELAPEVYAAIDKLVVDRWDVARASPDVKEMVRDGILHEERIHAELHELVSGTKPGRENERETIVFRADGLVSQDVAIAYAVYQTALARGLGVSF